MCMSRNTLQNWRYGDVEKKNRLIKLFLFSLYTKSILVAL